MNQNRELFNRSGNTGSFGLGFIVGTIFAVLVIFFISTKQGKELLKKLTSGEFSWSQLESLASRITPQEKHTNSDLEDNSQLESQSFTREEQTSGQDKTSISVLGRRFFRRHLAKPSLH